jgi:hypothetical protein
LTPERSLYDVSVVSYVGHRKAKTEIQTDGWEVQNVEKSEKSGGQKFQFCRKFKHRQNSVRAEEKFQRNYFRYSSREIAANILLTQLHLESVSLNQFRFPAPSTYATI